MSFPKIDGYIVTEKIGSGSYSVVYKAYTKVGARAAAAVKCVPRRRLAARGSADNLLTEIRLLKTLRHPHVLRLRDFTWDAQNVYIITEYCGGGDLAGLLRRRGRVPEHEARVYIQQLVSALQYLRENGVAHRDLKPHNLLLQKDAEGRVTLKLADFGFAQHLTADPGGSLRGSPLYMAPEVLAPAAGAAGAGAGAGAGTGAGAAGAGAGAGTRLSAAEANERADLWSLGVVLYELVTGRAPYASASLPALLRKVAARAPIAVPPGVSPAGRALLARLLQPDPARRMDYDELLAHVYIAGPPAQPAQAAGATRATGTAGSSSAAGAVRAAGADGKGAVRAAGAGGKGAGAAGAAGAVGASLKARVTAAIAKR